MEKVDLTGTDGCGVADACLLFCSSCQSSSISYDWFGLSSLSMS